MRRPTPLSDQYAWWRQALLDHTTPRHDGDPQPGYYRYRAVKGGPWLPVRVWLHQEIDPETGELANDERLMAEESGRRRDPCAIWTWLRPISRDDYRALKERHRADNNMHATHAAYDLGDAPMRPGGYTHA